KNNHKSEQIRNLNMKKIKLTRESVAMGDDIDAPHFLEIDIEPNWTITEILKYISNINYLPKISGGRATWSVAINEPIADLTQENPKLQFLDSLPDYYYHEVIAFAEYKLNYINYNGQKDDIDVFEVLTLIQLRYVCIPITKHTYGRYRLYPLFGN